MAFKSNKSSANKPPNAQENKAYLKSVAGDRPKTSPGLFEKSTLTRVTSSLPIWEASNILTQSQHLPWTTDPDGKLIYSRDVNDGKGAICFWVAGDTEDEHPSTLAGAAALAVIDTFDMRAACMHLIFAAYASQMEKPWEQELVIDDRQLESYLGLQRRTDKNRQEKLELIEEIVKQPCKITTFISWPRQGKSKGFTVEEGRLWHLLGTRYHYQQNIFGEKQLSGMSFVVKAGLWAKYFLNEDDAHEQNSPSSKGVLSKSLLENVMSLWQHRAGAARLMVWLLFKFQLNRLYTIPVRVLMEVAYGPDKVRTAKQDNQLRKKLTNTWDEDLLALHDRGWRIQFDAESYPNDIQPPGFGRENVRRPRGFFDQLLDAQLEIMPPESWNIDHLESATEASDEVALDLAVPTLTGSDVKSQRISRGWSQRKLATLTGISQGLISMIENETRSITEANESILKQTFEYM
ncbi:MAG: XRE family transcriptional regulator [Phormidesmis priestleyi]|uniref:XRE family transcriptional regulator n=1 Tax=Phormidesmis priestleyi TaxID=268141 RepID=A0A2W4XCS2_9CYAN|nr:MAG: XRE family transcriptional regulator [Phormidesmis priestleyi]